MVRVVVAVLGAVVLAACGQTGAVPEVGADWTPPAQSAAPSASAAEESAQRPEDSIGSKARKRKLATGQPVTVVVPDAVGLGLQEARSLWRGQGLALLRATDASGRNRSVMLESDWYVVDQNPRRRPRGIWERRPGDGAAPRRVIRAGEGAEIFPGSPAIAG